MEEKGWLKRRKKGRVKVRERGRERGFREK
jgi:Mn-dependent DtxR family transcriptional regulator